MSLVTRVARLERTHKGVLRCYWCRLALSDVPPSMQKQHDATSDSVLRTQCWHCGTKYVVPLRGLNEHQREALALIYNSHPTKQFTDERIHAASIWYFPYRSEVKEYQDAQQKQPVSQNLHMRPGNRAPRFLGVREERYKRERGELMSKAVEFIQTQTERYKRMADGPEFFPLDQTIKEIEKQFPTAYDPAMDDLIRGLDFEKYSPLASRLRSALALCNLHLQRLKKREACEIVLWSKLLPETLDEINFFEQEKQRVIEEALEAKKRDENPKSQAPSSEATRILGR